MRDIIETLLEKVKDRQPVNFEEAKELAEKTETDKLLKAANQIREFYKGNNTDYLCGVMNIKSGRCSEDCKYCSQSGHYFTNIKSFDLINVDEVVEFAKKYEKQGIKRFALSTSGKSFSETDKEKIYNFYKALSRETKLKLCGAHGLLTQEEAHRLKESGLICYQHNIQASRRFFPQICTTHTYDQRIETIKNARNAGMDVCSGGIMGMGESMDDRIEFAITLREFGIRAMPVNILNPVPGTPLGKKPPSITPDEVLRTIAVFRFVLPDVNLIYGAGRSFLGEIQNMALRAGVNGMVLGNFLTTPGRCIEDDVKMLNDEGFMVVTG
ncbi:MAG TPA: biotin synthase BioB [Candidatus Brocadiaceae bacterium]